jgi:galactosamine-6-phosphate isomerase
MRPIQVFPDHEAMSRFAAEWLVTRLRERPGSLVCLAAGSTPTRTYELLAERGAREPSLFDRCRLLKLDEWGGLAMDDPATCEHQLRSVLIAPHKLAERYAAFHSQPSDPQQECARIASWLEQHGPIDVCVLGLGINGHLGFNEPGEALEQHAHVATLSDASLTHAMLEKCAQLPTYGLTLGLADILQAREILLLVSGTAKREPLRCLLSGQITTQFPASLLHLHPRVTLVCDQSAQPEVKCSSD